MVNAQAATRRFRRIDQIGEFQQYLVSVVGRTFSKQVSTAIERILLGDRLERHVCGINDEGSRCH